MPEIINPPSLVEQVYEAVLAEIVEGKLPPHARLIQDELATAYGVSRQPVQQALLLLRKHGLISDAPRRGLIVAPLDVDFVRHLYEVRATLEALAARRAAEHSAARAAAEGARFIERGRSAVAAGALSEEIEADTAFHAFIYDLSGNPLILETVGPQRHFMRRVMAAVLRDDDHRIPGRIWDEHSEILRAIERGDSEKAAKLSSEHIDRAAGIFIARLKSQQESDEAEQESRRRVRRLARR